MKRIFWVSLILILSISKPTFAALMFDGINDYVKVPDSDSLDLNNGMTIEVWIKPNAAPDARVFVSKWKDGPIDHSYIFKDHNASDKLRIELSNTGDGRFLDLEGQTSIPYGQWTHVATTYDLNYGKLYLNGNLENSKKILLPYAIHNSAIDLLIGAVNFSANGDSTENFDGLIDEVRIWNYARSEQQLQDSMFEFLVGNESGLVGYWNFSEGSGQIAHDLSPYANDGQLGSTSGVDAHDPLWITSDRNKQIIPEPSTLFAIGLSFVIYFSSRLLLKEL